MQESQEEKEESKERIEDDIQAAEGTVYGPGIAD